jgi:hypothetical protein
LKKNGNSYAIEVQEVRLRTLRLASAAPCERLPLLVVSLTSANRLALMEHKILRVIYTLLKKKALYCDASIDYEALAVKCNAPRWIQALKKFGYLQQVDTNPAAG